MPWRYVLDIKRLGLDCSQKLAYKFKYVCKDKLEL
jgi:hypothetical protein